MSNVQRFGAIGDGVTDDTDAIRHTIQYGDGMLHFPPGSYRISQTLEIPLAESGPSGIDGTGGTARILLVPITELETRVRLRAMSIRNSDCRRSGMSRSKGHILKPMASR